MSNYLTLILLMTLQTAVCRETFVLFEDSFPAINAEPDNRLNPFSDPNKPSTKNAKNPQPSPEIVRSWLRNPDAPLPTGPATEEVEITHTMQSFNPSMDSFQQYSDLKLFVKKYGGKKVYLKAEKGKLLATCFNCGKARFDDSASVEGKIGDPASEWTVKLVDNKITLTNSNKKRLCSCFRCWDVASYNDAAFVQSEADADSPKSALWIPIKQSKNTWLFRSDKGTYLGLCPDCVPSAKYQNFAFVHLTDKDPFAFWKVSLVSPKSRTKTSAKRSLKHTKKHKTKKAQKRLSDRHKVKKQKYQKNKSSLKGIFRKKKRN